MPGPPRSNKESALSGAPADRLRAWWEAAPRQRRRLRQDEILFHRGDPVSVMYWVEEGRVRLERRTIDGRLLVLHSAAAGELLAEASLFAEAYHCDATAPKPALVSLCAKSELLAAMASDPMIALQFGRTVARKLQGVRQRLELRNVRSARERLLLFLELEADPLTHVLTVPGALQDIAADLGLTREALYRTLADLERAGEIRRDGKSIALLRPVA